MNNINGKNIFLRLLSLSKLPIFLLLIGLALEYLPLLNLVDSIKWSSVFAVLSGLGSIVVTLAFFTFFYLIILSILAGYEKFILKKENKTLANIIILIKKGMHLIFFLVSVNIILDQFKIKDAHLVMVNNIIYVFIISAVAWILLQILNIVEEMLHHKFLNVSIKSDTKHAVALYTKIHIIKKIAELIIITLAIAASLMVFDKVRNIGISLLASAGVFTAVLALAAQKILSSLLFGLRLVMTHPLEIGDMVVVENETGIIEEMSLSYVIVKLGDLKRFIFPVNYFFENPFQNLSCGKDGLLAVVKIYADYAIPLEPLRKELDKIVKENKLWNRKVCNLAISDCNERVIELRIMVSTSHPNNLDPLRCELREKILNFICTHYPETLPRHRIYQQSKNG